MPREKETIDLVLLKKAMNRKKKQLWITIIELFDKLWMNRQTYYNHLQQRFWWIDYWYICQYKEIIKEYNDNL